MPQKPRVNVGWMAQVAQGKREAMASSMNHIAKTFSIAILKLCKSFPAYKRSPYMDEGRMEHFFKYMQDEIKQLGWTEEQILKAQRDCIKLAFGDPHIMHVNGQKLHGIPYWNPTPRRVNISPMGLVKELDEKTREAKFYEFVEPGEHIMIPEGYTVGGKYSTVFGVAPQLRPLPRQIDSHLDLSPLTYTEWCTYMEPNLSPCCGKTIAWHDNTNCLRCTKCGKFCNGARF